MMFRIQPMGSGKTVCSDPLKGREPETRDLHSTASSILSTFVSVTSAKMLSCNRLDTRQSIAAVLVNGVGKGPGLHRAPLGHSSCFVTSFATRNILISVRPQCISCTAFSLLPRARLTYTHIRTQVGTYTHMMIVDTTTTTVFLLRHCTTCLMPRCLLIKSI
jgi:hypothetical protein